MRDINCKRPEDIECDNIWELYRELMTLDKPYIKAKLKGDDGEYLYHIGSISIGAGETHYSFDLPSYRYETIKLRLERILCNEQITRELELQVNSYSVCDRTLTGREILDKCGVKFTDEAELEKTDFEKDVPVTYIERKPGHVQRHQGRRNRSPKPLERATRFKSFLDATDISYIMDSDCGVPHFSMIIPIPDCPVGCIESSIWFCRHEAIVRTYYPKPVNEISEKSGHRDEFLRLLNFINARIYPAQASRLPDKDEPQVYLAPRFHIMEDGSFDIAATTFVNYQIWDHVYEIDAYITGYCPELMNDLAPYVVCVLTGALTAEDAIERIETELLNAD